jgi:sugar phosphate isomerase/epimerase
MSNDIRVGFSMHPRWVDHGDLESFVTPLRSAGLSALEFELDDHLDLWTDFAPLMEAAFRSGLELCFHAPYRPPRSLVGFAAERRSTIAREYRPMLDIAEEWTQRRGEASTVVVHAARARLPVDPRSLLADTEVFLHWLLRTYPGLCFALENDHPPEGDEVKIGVEREAILAMLASVQNAHLGACWDMGHDVLRNKTEEEPTPAWLSKVAHVHVHDVDNAGKDHYPLVFGNVPCVRWLRLLRKAKMKGIAVLELQGGRLMNWPIEKITAALTDSVASIAREVG